MTILNYPTEPCSACKGDTWLYRSGTWVCGVCHPPTSKQDTIKMRIIKGNYLLNKMRWQLTAEEFIETVSRLRELWRQLNKTDCLYIESGKKLKKCVPGFHGEVGIECFTCANTYWVWVEVADKVGKEKKG